MRKGTALFFRYISVNGMFRAVYVLFRVCFRWRIATRNVVKSDNKNACVNSMKYPSSG